MRPQKKTSKKTVCGLIKTDASSVAFLFLALFLSQTSIAQTYRWVDKDGNTHFGDKPPKEQQAENISASVQNSNIDHSATSTKKQIRQINNQKSALQKERNDLAAQKNKQKRPLSQACSSAKRQLAIIKGRVIFYDENRKEVKTTEKERARMAEELEEEARKRCR